MPHPPPDLPDPRLERWDRGTRRWGRIGALVLFLGVLLPNPWVDRTGNLHFVWFWQDPDHPDAGRVEYLLGHGPLPTALFWLLASACLWWAAGTRLRRRGALLTMITALVAALQANAYNLGSRERAEVWPLGWAHLALFAAVLGLLLVWTRAQRSAGRLLCLLAGLFTLGTVLLPQGNWTWPHLEQFVELLEREGYERWYTIYFALWMVLGILLVRVGLARHSPPRLAAAPALLLGGTLLIGHWANYQYWRQEVLADGDSFFSEVATLFTNLRSWARPYGIVMLLVSGIFAWLASTRAERGRGSVA